MALVTGERVNLEVFVRVRPHMGTDQEEIAVKCVDEDGLQLSTDSAVRRFHKVFTEESEQEEIYVTVGKRGISQVLTGYYSTIILYGQTGSGKTYTANGLQGNRCLSQKSGLIPRCIHGIFEQIACDAEHDYRVEIEWIQIYQENVLDLLTSNSTTSLQIRECPDNGVLVVGAAKVLLNSPIDFLDLLRTADKNRITALTKMNATSSRSHSCLMVTVHKRRTLTIEDHCMHSDSRVLKASNKIIKGRLSLVDLAGSERLKKSQSEGQRKTEAKYINSSLACLGNVLQAIVDKQKHIPYRDSKLTRLLQDSLGGSGIASFVVTVSPLSIHSSETYYSILFAERAKEVCNAPIIHREFGINEKWLVLQAALEDKIALLEAKNRRLEASKTNILHDTDEITTSSSLNKKIRDLYSMLREKEYQLELSSQRLSEAEGTVSSLNEKQRTLIESISSHQDTIITLEEECSSAKIQLRSQESELSLSKGQHYTATAANNGLDLLLDELKGRLERQEQEHLMELTDLRQNMETERRSTQMLMQQQRDKAEPEIAMLRTTIENKSRENEILTSDLKKLRSELKDLRDKKNSSDKEELNDLKRQLTQKQSSIETLKYELEEQQITSTDLQQQLLLSKQKLNNLQTDLIEVQRTTDKALLKSSSDLQQCNEAVRIEKAQSRALTEELQNSLIRLKEASQPCESCPSLTSENERLLNSISEHKRDSDKHLLSYTSQIDLLNEQLSQLQDCAKCSARSAENEVLEKHNNTLQSDLTVHKNKNKELAILLNQLEERQCDECVLLINQKQQLELKLQTVSCASTDIETEYSTLKERYQKTQTALSIQVSEQEQHIQLIQQLRDSEIKYSTRVSSLEETVAVHDSLKKQFSHLQNNHNSLLSEHESSKQELDQRSNDLMKIASQFEQMELDNTTLSTTLQSALAELEISKKAESSQAAEKETLTVAANTFQLKNEALQQQLDRANEETAKVSEEVIQRMKSEEDNSHLTEVVNNLQQDNNRMNEELMALVELNESYEGKLNQLRSSNKELERDNENLEKSIERYNQNHIEAVEVIEQHNQKLADYKDNEIDSLNNQISQLTENKVTISSELQSLRLTQSQEHDEGVAALSLLKAKLSASDRKNQKLTNTVSDQEQEISQQTKQIELLSTSETVASDLTSQLSSLQKQSKDEITSLQEEINSLRMERDVSITKTNDMKTASQQQQQRLEDLKKQNETLELNINELNLKLNDLQQIYNNCSEHNESLKNNIDVLTTTNITLDDQVKDIQQANEQNVATITQLSLTNADAETKSIELQLMIEELSDGKVTLQSTVDNMTGVNVELQLEIENHQRAISKLSETNESLKNSYETLSNVNNALEEELNENTEGLKNKQAVITSLKTQLDTYTEAVSVMQSSKSEDQEQITTTEKTVSDLRNTISTLQRESTEKCVVIDNLNAEISLLQSTQEQQLASLDTRLADSREMMLVLQEERKGYVSQIDLLSSKLALSRETCRDLENKKTENDNQIIELTKSVTTLQKQFDIALVEKTILSKEMSTVQSTLSSLSSGSSESSTRIDDLSVELNDSNKQNNILSAKVDSLTQELTAMQEEQFLSTSAIEEKDLKLSSLIQQLSSSTDANKEFQDDLLTLRTQLANQEEDNDRLKEEYYEAVEEYETLKDESIAIPSQRLLQSEQLSRSDIIISNHTQLLQIATNFIKQLLSSATNQLHLDEQLTRYKLTSKYYLSVNVIISEYNNSLRCNQGVVFTQIQQKDLEIQFANSEIQRQSELLEIVNQRHEKLAEISQLVRERSDSGVSREIVKSELENSSSSVTVDNTDLEQQLFEKENKIIFLNSSLKQMSNSLQASVQDRHRLQRCLSAYTQNLKKFAAAEDAFTDLSDQSSATTAEALRQEISHLNNQLGRSKLQQVAADYQLGAYQLSSACQSSISATIGLELTSLRHINSTLEQDVKLLKTNFSDCNSLLQQTMESLTSKVTLSSSLQDRLSGSENRLLLQQQEASDKNMHLTITISELQNALQTERDLYKRKVDEFCKDGKIKIARVSELLEEQDNQNQITVPLFQDVNITSLEEVKDDNCTHESQSTTSLTPVRATAPHTVTFNTERNKDLLESVFALDSEIESHKKTADADTLRQYVLSLEKEVKKVTKEYHVVLSQLSSVKDAFSTVVSQRDELVGRLFSNNTSTSTIEGDEFREQEDIIQQLQTSNAECEKLSHVVDILKSDINQLNLKNNQTESFLLTTTTDRDTLQQHTDAVEKVLFRFRQERDNIFDLIHSVGQHTPDTLFEIIKLIIDERDHYKMMSSNTKNDSLLLKEYTSLRAERDLLILKVQGSSEVSEGVTSDSSFLSTLVDDIQEKRNTSVLSEVIPDELESNTYRSRQQSTLELLDEEEIKGSNLLFALQEDLRTVTTDRDDLLKVVADLQEERHTFAPDELNFSDLSIRSNKQVADLKEELNQVRNERDRLLEETENQKVTTNNNDKEPSSILKQLKSIQQERNKLLKMVREITPRHEVSNADEFNESNQTIIEESNNSDYEPHESSGSEYEPNTTSPQRQQTVSELVAERDQLLQTIDLQTKSTQKCFNSLNEERQTLLSKLSTSSSTAAKLKRQNNSLTERLQLAENDNKTSITDKVVMEHEQEAFDTLQTDRLTLTYQNKTLRQQLKVLNNEVSIYKEVFKELRETIPSDTSVISVETVKQIGIELVDTIQKLTTQTSCVKLLVKLIMKESSLGEHQEEYSDEYLQTVVSCFSDLQSERNNLRTTVLDLETKLLTTTNTKDTVSSATQTINAVLQDCQVQTTKSIISSKSVSRKTAELENEIQILKQQHNTRERDLKLKLRGRQKEIRRLQSLLPLSASDTSNTSGVTPEEVYVITEHKQDCINCLTLESKLQEHHVTEEELKVQLTEKQQQISELRSELSKTIVCDDCETFQKQLISLKSQLTEKQQITDCSECEGFQKEVQNLTSQLSELKKSQRPPKPTVNVATVKHHNCSNCETLQKLLSKLQLEFLKLESLTDNNNETPDCKRCPDLQIQLTDFQKECLDLRQTTNTNKKENESLMKTIDMLQSKQCDSCHKLKLEISDLKKSSSESFKRSNGDRSLKSVDELTSRLPPKQLPENLIETLTELLENNNGITNCSQCLLKDSIIHSLRVKQVTLKSEGSKAVAMHSIADTRRVEAENRISKLLETPKTVPQLNSTIVRSSFAVSAPPELSPFVPIMTSASPNRSDRSPTPPPTLPRKSSINSSYPLPYPVPDLKTYVPRFELRQLSPSRIG